MISEKWPTFFLLYSPLARQMMTLVLYIHFTDRKLAYWDVKYIAQGHRASYGWTTSLNCLSSACDGTIHNPLQLFPCLMTPTGVRATWGQGLRWFTSVSTPLVQEVLRECFVGDKFWKELFKFKSKFQVLSQPHCFMPTMISFWQLQPLYHYCHLFPLLSIVLLTPSEHLLLWWIKQ